MIRSTNRFLGAAGLSAVLLVVGACGSDEPAASAPAATTADASAVTAAASDGATDVTLDEAAAAAAAAAGVSGDCLALSATFMSAMSGIGTGSESIGDLGPALADMASKVPAELQADVQLLSDGFAKFGAALAAHDNDMAKLMADPAALAELQALSSPEFQAASDKLNAYFEASCQTGG